jgi:hypothetical protein
MRARGVLACAAMVLLAAPCGAQDFAGPIVPGEPASPAAFLEHALPPARPAVAGEALASSWFAVPGLTTRALALAGGWRALRVAGGVSQSGDDDLGWSATALAAGVSSGVTGGALRIAARRDGGAGALDAALGPGTGLEVGGGAWVEVGAGLVTWASAPQVWARGVAPPLRRGFEIGATWVMDDLALRLGRASPGGEGGSALHEAALSLSAGALTAWLEARDQPLRGSLGLAARAGPVSVAGVVESHPLLGETVRLSLALGGGGRGAAAPP